MREQIQSLEFSKLICDFIDQAVNRFTTCCIISQNNKCSSVIVAILYFMYKFRWSLVRVLEFINMRKPDAEISKGIIKCLKEHEKVIASRLVSADFSKQLPISIRLRFDWKVDSLDHGFTDATLKQAPSYERLTQHIRVQSPNK